MTTIHLQASWEKLASTDPFGLRDWPLYHQVRTVEALQRHDLVANTHNTGTGKTIASLLYLFDLAGRDTNVLFIAPTNELIHQHVTDIRDFVREAELDYLVMEVNAALLRQIATGQRPGETLHRLVRNPREFAEPLGLDLTDYRRRPVVLVVNPDIFYYALYFRYGAHDQRNAFERFLTDFDYIVVDEFHYYNAKQLANFLFFFAISREFGYFDGTRKVCLLSATPAPEVNTYLNRVFGDDGWALVSPASEPEDSADYERVNVLTELELMVVEGALQEYAAARRGDIVDWLSAGRHGAIISNALWRINEAYQALAGLDAGRITGPEPIEARRQARFRPLILATPTVDIGYNFVKQDKQRQNLDFVIFDARCHDDFLQRMGRAGRVLGKPVTDIPSRAVALLSANPYAALREHDGKRLSRTEFAALVRQALPPRNALYAYIRSGAIVESFYPIYKLRGMFPPAMQGELEALFETVKEAFAPTSRRTFRGLTGEMRKFEERRRFVEQGERRKLAEHFADFYEWRAGERVSPRDLAPIIPDFLADPERKRLFVEYVAGEYHLARSRFSFRDSFQGPRAVIHDPQHLLSSAEVTIYDLLHVVANYTFELFDGWAAFHRHCAVTGERGGFYLRLRGFRETKLRIGFSLRTDMTSEEFEERCCSRLVALRGLRLTAFRQGDPFPLDSRIREPFEEQYVTCLIVKPEDRGALFNVLRDGNIFARRLLVRTAEGEPAREYHIVVGSAAFIVHAELAGYFYARQSENARPIIL